MYVILNWMDGETRIFDTEEDGQKEFDKLRKLYEDDNVEFDMVFYKIIDQYNNID